MILSCGEALIDMLPRQSDKGEDAFAPFPGGAVFNTAIALGRLGVPAGFLSGLSSDLFGQMLQDALRASGVDGALSVISDRPTTLAFVRLIDGQAAYAFYDENTAGRMLDASQLPDIPNHVSAMFFGGISLVAEPCGSFYEALMKREADARITMIDPNIRPGFVTDEPSYRARINRMIDMADIVKLSDEDLHWLAGDGDLAELAKAILARGPRLVFVTEGAKGAHGFSADHSVFVAAEKVTVVDTVGAGDTFNAGVMAAIHQAGALSKSTIVAASADTIRDAVQLGVRSAAITVSRAGANPPWARDL